MQKTFEFGVQSINGPPRRRNRKSDPLTSVDSAGCAVERAGGVKLLVLSVASDEPMTANELAHLAVQKYGGNRETCRKRAMELSKPDDGRLRQAGTKVCQITGAEASAFVLTGQ